VRVSVDGVDTSQFEKNPVMFYLHNDWNMPVGRWENVRKENGQLLADAVFDTEDTDKDVQRMIKKVANGFIKMASCGLVDLEVSAEPLIEDTNITVVNKCRLREASIVPIGGNHNALRLYDREGKEIDFKQDAGIKLSDFIVKPKIENMYKKYLSQLNLADTATEAEFFAKVGLLLEDKAKVDGELAAEKLKVTAAETAKAALQTKLEGIELADKTAKKSAYETELAEAFKDGRLSEKPEGEKLTPVKDSFLSLFDKDPEMAMTVVKTLPKHVPGSINLTDNIPTGETKWQKRQREIDEAAAKRK